MKRKINIDRPPLASSEIAAKQDFSSILTQVPKVPATPFYKSGWFISTVASVAGIAVITTYFLTNDKNITPNEELTSEVITTEAPPNDSKSTFIYNEDTPCINPPSKEHDIPMESYFVNADKGGEITTKSGNKINVLPKSFRDENGNLISGQVELQFREISNPIEMMISGIPMHYDSAGIEMVLLSDGMIELHGFQNGKRLEIIPDKALTVSIQSENSDTKFNSYFLNEANNNWEYTGKPEIIVEESNITESGDHHPKTIEKVDLVKLETDVKIAQANYEEAIQQTKYLEKQAPQPPVNNGNKDRQFMLDVNPKEFPELSGYQSLVFEVTANDPNFSPSVYQEEWEDISLMENVKGKTYYLTLFKKGAKKTFSVFPVFTGKDYELAKSKFETSFSNYSKELTKRQQNEAKLKSEFDQKLAKWEEAKKAELQVQEQIQIQTQQSAKLVKLAKKLVVNRFGVWNVDCGISPPSGISQKVKFVDEQNKPLMVNQFNLYEKGKNTLYSYSINEKNNKFEFDPNENNMIIAILSEEEIGYAKNDQFNSSKECTYELKIIPFNDASIEFLKSM